MRRYICFFGILSLLVVMFSGCGFWMDGEYVSVEPYQQGVYGQEQEIIKVSSYSQMCNELVLMVENGIHQGIFDVSEFGGGSVHLYADTAVRYAMNSSPVGAYAVDSIDYEIGTRTGVDAMAIQIHYRVDRARILQVKQVTDMDQAKGLITEALTKAEPFVVIRVASYVDTDLIQWIDEQAALFPDVIMESPTVEAAVFPQQGLDRILEVSFTYNNSRDELLQMQQKVESVFTAAELYVKDATQVREKYAQMYAFLMERSEYQLERSATPAYSLLFNGTGDDRAFAEVYAAMCRRAELECYVVSGTRNGAPWNWNLINFRGSYYHLDLNSSVQPGEFAPKLPSEMAGYTWDHDAYPQ